MDDPKLTQCIDFLDIALEEIEHGNYESAKDFVEDVAGTLQDEYDGK